MRAKFVRPVPRKRLIPWDLPAYFEFFTDCQPSKRWKPASKKWGVDSAGCRTHCPEIIRRPPAA